jgi:predicted PolB exonuclease-like 3'-5' exonuclease
MSKNKVRRYRINPMTAQKLGLKINNSNRYRLSKEQESKYLNFDMQPIKRLFFDIETSPIIAYTWRVGWKLNIDTDNIIQDWKIICISYGWEDEDKVHTLTWDENQCDKQMLIDFIKIANTADELVAHNGDKFDIKKIRTKCIFHRIPMFPNYRTLDTLKKAKSGFVFNSNRLDYIAKYLGVGAKLEHEGFNMWVKCMQGDKEALADMVKYCEMDIVVLQDVFLVMQSYIKQNQHVGTLNMGRKCDCPSCGSLDVTYLKLNVTSFGTPKRQFECDVCSHAYEISNSAYRKYLGL